MGEKFGIAGGVAEHRDERDGGVAEDVPAAACTVVVLGDAEGPFAVVPNFVDSPPMAKKEMRTANQL